jgi:hypothetical protein
MTKASMSGLIRSDGGNSWKTGLAAHWIGEAR